MENSPFSQYLRRFLFVLCICHMSFELRILRRELQIFLTFERELNPAVVPEEIMPLQLNLRFAYTWDTKGSCTNL